MNGSSASEGPGPSPENLTASSPSSVSAISGTPGGPAAREMTESGSARGSPARV